MGVLCMKLTNCASSIVTLCGQDSVNAMILSILTTNNSAGKFPDNEIRH